MRKVFRQLKIIYKYPWTSATSYKGGISLAYFLASLGLTVPLELCDATLLLRSRTHAKDGVYNLDGKLKTTQ